MHPGIIHDYNFHRFTNHVLPLFRQRDRCSQGPVGALTKAAAEQIASCKRQVQIVVSL